MINIITPCSMVLSCIEFILKSESRNYNILNEYDDVNHEGISGEELVNCDYIVYIPDEPLYFLLVLKRVLSSLNKMLISSKFIIISNAPAQWLLETIHNNTEQKELANPIIIPANLSAVRLHSVLLKLLSDDLQLNKSQIRQYDLFKPCYKALSYLEIDALIDMFNGDNVINSQMKRKKSPKTIYNHRLSGMKKMITYLPGFSNNISGAVKRWHVNVSETKHIMSRLESDLVCGFEMNEVKSYYQPIVDQTKGIRGFEILIRWEREDKIIYPNDFLTSIQSEKTLMRLTALTIQDAIDGINNFNGKYYFSINVHSLVAEQQSFVKIVREACRILKNPLWCNKLVFEYCEDIDLNNKKENNAILHELSLLGVNVILDDCFSSRSVFFPVRTSPFCGYKIDKSVINNVFFDNNDLALVKALLYYCELSDKNCIAEGIEDEITFQKLVDIGVKSFQGYFFFKALSNIEMHNLVMITSKEG